MSFFKKVSVGIVATISCIVMLEASESIKTMYVPKCMEFNQDESILAYGTYQKVVLINTKTQDTITVIEYDGPAENVAFVGDKLIASGGQYVLFWDIKTNQLIKQVKRQEESYFLEVSAQTGIAYVGNKLIEGYDIKTGQSVFSLPLPRSAPLRTLRVTPDGSKLIVNYLWGSILDVIDIKSKKITEIKNNNEFLNPSDVIAAPDNTSLYVFQPFKTIKRINFKGEILGEIGGTGQYSLGRCSISPDHKYLLLPMGANPNPILSVIVCDLQKNKVIKEIPVGKDYLRSAIMKINPGTVFVLENNQNKEIKTYPFKPE